ncbi:MAG: histidinol-phosphate aminotransferase family protein [Silvibacterium sp.]|nr:histidinol-phosphate aminotransferase family protein [Silvibacterium sp.]
MLTSRRVVLRSLAASAATGLAVPATPRRFSGVIGFDPDRSTMGESLIRLDHNENPYGPSRKVLDAIQGAMESVNRYPVAGYGELRERIAHLHGVKPQQILLGCGSTDVLRMAAFAFLAGGKQLIQASPTFEAIESYAQRSGAEVVSVRLAPGFAHDLERMSARTSAAPALVYICNPNNPTASLNPREDLEAFIGKLPVSAYVVIDEAYHHYAGQSGMYASFVDRPVDNQRVIVTRTFSAVYGLAALRLGYAVASPDVVRAMGRFAGEDNINGIVMQAALAALDDIDAVNDFVRQNADDRQEFFNQAMARAMKPIDSHANFVMMNTYHPAEDVIEHFRKNGVLIGRSFPAMNTYIRVSLGRPEEMRRFWQAWDALPYPKHTMQH